MKKNDRLLLCVSYCSSVSFRFTPTREIVEEAGCNEYMQQ